ncbi:DEP domain-containing protein 1A [Trichinella nelsoni]|uniref:DEP domain-containing protein 1A n=1 Tax=Trichinella nelsoni TaxID=6336 RepID=A0A0V0RSM2_9BILA|nr:DEP domain-containing protein 1A [Trichinella nelsoni]
MSSAEVEQDAKYSATLIWNDVVRNFRSKMVLKNHWRYFTIYPNTFTGQEATDWLYNYLISKTKSKSKITKEKVKILLKKFYEREVFVEVIHSKKSKDEIIKDGRSLYRFTDAPLSALVQTPLALKMNRIKKEVHAMCPEKRHSAGLPSNLLEREKILCNTNRSVSMENIPFEKSAIDASLVFYNANQFEIASKVNSNIDEPPPQIVQSMNCLANWPRRNEGVHIGFEMDILQTLATFFRNQKLIPKGLLMLSFTIMERARQLDGKLSNHMHYCARNSAFLSHSDLSCDYLAPVHRVSKNVTPLFQSNQTDGASLKKYSAIATDIEKPVMMNRYCLASSNSPKDKLEALSGLPGLVKSPTLVKTLEENTELLECPVSSLKSFVKVQRAATLSTPKQRPRHLAGQFNAGDAVEQSLERRTFSTLFPITFRLSHVKELTIETVRNCFFMLDVKRRRWLQLLLRFMARVSTNHRLQLDKYGTTSNRVLVVDTFSSCFCLNEEKRRAVELLKFLLHHQLEIFAPSKRLEHDVNVRISQLIFDEEGSIEEGISVTSSLSLISRNDHGDGNFDDTKNTDQCVLLKNSNKQKNSNECIGFGGICPIFLPLSAGCCCTRNLTVNNQLIRRCSGWLIPIKPSIVVEKCVRRWDLDDNGSSVGLIIVGAQWILFTGGWRIPEQVKAEIRIVDRRSGQLLHRCWIARNVCPRKSRDSCSSTSGVFVFGHVGRPTRNRTANSVVVVVVVVIVVMMMSSVLLFIGCWVQLTTVLTWALVMKKSTGPLEISAGDGFQVQLYDGQVSITTNQRHQQPNDTDIDLHTDSKNASAVIDDLLSEVVHNSMNDMLLKLSESLKTIIDKFQPKVESTPNQPAPLNMTRYSGRRVAEKAEMDDSRLVDGLFSLLNMISSRGPTSGSLELGTVTPATSTLQPTTASSRPATVVEVPMELILQQIKFNSSTSTVVPTLVGGGHGQSDNRKNNNKPIRLVEQADFVPSSHQLSKKSKTDHRYLVETVLIAVGAVFGILTVVSIGMIVATFCQLKKPRHRSWALPVDAENSKTFLEPGKITETQMASNSPCVDSYDRDVETMIAFTGLTASLDDSARHSNLYSKIRI